MQTIQQIKAHHDDVNAVTFLDDSSNVIVSGSDDHLIKVSFLEHRRPLVVAAVAEHFLDSLQQLHVLKFWGTENLQVPYTALFRGCSQ